MSSPSHVTPHNRTTPSTMADGTWEISVYISDLDFTKRIRVRGDLHIGGLMLKIVEGQENCRDWSDFAIWWPKRNCWLLRTRLTLDQYNVQAGTVLQFLSVHEYLYLQLPDLQIIHMRVDFSLDVFSVVVKTCKELGIRHPEEVSLSVAVDREDLKKSYSVMTLSRNKLTSSHRDVLTSDAHGRTISRDSLSSVPPQFHRCSNQSLPLSVQSNSSFLRGSFYGNRDTGRFSLRRKKSRTSLTRTPSTPLSPPFNGSTLSRSTFDANSTSPVTPEPTNNLIFWQGRDLVNSPWVSYLEASSVLPRPKNMAEKARCNSGWLDSSRSLMEQAILPSTLLLLKFKFYNFYDLNPKHDGRRINQLYEQAKWSVLTEEVGSTREEMVAFAALQLHIQQLGQSAQHSDTSSTISATTTRGDDDYDSCRTAEDLIDAALNDLQQALEGTTFPAPFSARLRSNTGSKSGCNSFNKFPSNSNCANSMTLRCNGCNSSSSPTPYMPSAYSSYSITSSATASPFYPSSDFYLSSRASNLNVNANQSHVNSPLPSLIQDITQVPELNGFLRFYKPKKFFLKSYKRHFFTFKDFTLSMSKAAGNNAPLWSLNIKGCEVVSEVLLDANKYIIKLIVPSLRGLDAIWFKMDHEDQYINWLAGMRLACRGRTMADRPSFHEEVMTIQDKLTMLRGGKSVNKQNTYNNNGVVDDNKGSTIRADQQQRPPPSLSRKDSKRKSFLSRTKYNESTDELQKLNRNDSILRSKVKPPEFNGTKQGEGSQPTNGAHMGGGMYSTTNGNHPRDFGYLDNNATSNPGSISSSLVSIPKSISSSLYCNLAPKDFLAPRFCRRSKLKQLLHKISDSVEEMKDSASIDCKLAYIKAWQSLPDFGHTYFIIRLKGSRKEDFLALTPTKINLLDGGSGEMINHWRYQNLRSWSVNWEVKQLLISFEDDELMFQCSSSDCKVIHEFIGGYIFLSMRSPERNHKLNQELFHKLTGGWS